MSFANQAPASEYLLLKGGRVERQVYRIPEEIDELPEEQVHNLSSWTMGT
jgi:S-adenosylhomocysteine hydrolase